MFNHLAHTPFNHHFAPTPISVVGTWDAVSAVFIHGQRLLELAVVQFKPDGTFVEGFDFANHASTYTGRYNFDGHRIGFIIDSAAGDGPQPVPFQQLALSSRVFSNPTSVRLNNDLRFVFQSTSVAPSDFVLPPAPTPNVISPFGFHSMFHNDFAFNHPSFFAPHF